MKVPALVLWKLVGGTAHGWLAVSGLMGEPVLVKGLCPVARRARGSQLSVPALDSPQCEDCKKGCYAVTVALPHADALATQALQAAKDAGITSFKALLRKVFG